MANKIQVLRYGHKQVWLLEWIGRLGYVCPALDDHGGPSALAYFLEREAMKAAKFQKDTYDVDCKPVRVM